MTTPLPGMSPQLASPPVRKTPVQCCGYTSLQGTPQPWVCPGCGTRHDPNLPPATPQTSPSNLE